MSYTSTVASISFECIYSTVTHKLDIIRALCLRGLNLPDSDKANNFTTFNLNQKVQRVFLLFLQFLNH